MKHINTLRNKKGMALLTVMLIFFVLSILLAGLVSVTNSNLKQSVVTKNHTAAFYASEAGVTKVSTDFEKELNRLKELNKSSTDFLAGVNSFVNSNSNKTITLENNNGETSKAIITITNEGVDAQGYSNYKLTSKGYVGNLERTLVKTYRFKYTQGTTGSGFTIDKAVIAKNKLLINGGEISGAPITSYNTSVGSIEFTSGGKVDSIELINSNNYNNLITKPSYASLSQYFHGNTVKVNELSKVNTFPPINLPAFPAKNTLSKLPNYSSSKGFKIVENGNLRTYGSGDFNNTIYILPDNTEHAYYVPEFNISNNYGFTIDVGNNDRLLIVDKLMLNSNLWIKGEGTLTIYVTSNSSNITNNLNDKISFNFNNNTAGYIGNITHPERFKVFVDDIYVKKSGSNIPGTVSFGGYAPFYMSILAKNLNFELSGSAGYQGYLVTGGEEVKITGGSSARVALYYAPNADFTLSSVLKGAVIADNFTANWGGNLTYSDVLFENFPFEVLDPITGGTGSGAPVLDLVKSSTIEQ